MKYNTVDYIVQSTGERKYGGFKFNHADTWKKTIEKSDRIVSQAEGSPCKTVILNGNAR